MNRTHAVFATVMLALAGGSHAFAADRLPSSQLEASSSEHRVALSSEVNGRADWNVDYPSQLGPQTLKATGTSPARASTPANGRACDCELAHPEP
jgi:hypothetical protein